jgi:hypothetical protein
MLFNRRAEAAQREATPADRSREAVADHRHAHPPAQAQTGGCQRLYQAARSSRNASFTQSIDHRLGKSPAAFTCIEYIDQGIIGIIGLIFSHLRQKAFDPLVNLPIRQWLSSSTAAGTKVDPLHDQC